MTTHSNVRMRIATSFLQFHHNYNDRTFICGKYTQMILLHGFYDIRRVRVLRLMHNFGKLISSSPARLHGCFQIEIKIFVKRALLFVDSQLFLAGLLNENLIVQPLHQLPVSFRKAFPHLADQTVMSLVEEVAKLIAVFIKICCGVVGCVSEQEK